MKELLMPAGNLAILKKAVLSGADAIYIGGKMFGARAFAQNFTKEEIIEARQFCHLYGAKLYVTVNTMILEPAWKEVEKYIKFLNDAHVDAVIVSDFGLISYIHENYPNLAIHVSTQAHTFSATQMKFLKKLGATRVVLDRELSLEEITRLPNILEKEVFIHGALCVSYSGQCLLSALDNKRSGNLGTCSQSCRMPYKLFREGKEIKTDAYLLSTKDLNSLETMTELLQSDITSFKIEGRMKSIEYVAFLTALYRKIMDSKTKEVPAKDKDLCKVLFNREFTKGYLFKEPNIMNMKSPNHQGIKIGEVEDYNSQKIKIKLTRDLTQEDGIRFFQNQKGMIVNFLYDEQGKLIHVGKKGTFVYVDNKVHLKAKDIVLKTLDRTLDIQSIPVKKIPISLHIIIDRPFLTASINSTISLQKEIGEIPKTKKTTLEEITKCFQKLGNTPFVLKEIIIDEQKEAFLPMSKLNEFRRELIQKYQEEREK